MQTPYNICRREVISLARVHGKYLYGFVPAGGREKYGRIGVGNPPAQVYTLPFQDIAAVVSDSFIDERTFIKDRMIQHQRALSAVFRHSDVAPMRFGILARTEDEVLSLVRENYTDIFAALEQVRNCIEVGLKVFWTKQSFVKEMAQLDPRVTEWQTQIQAIKNESQSYHLTVQLGELVAHLADARREYYQEHIYEPLAKAADKAVVNKILMERMVFNASFLVQKERENAFDLLVNEVYRPVENLLTFKYTGPWPPYNFVRLRLSATPEERM